MIMKNKKKEGLHSFAMLFIVIVVAAALTYIVPAGVYERVTDAVTGRSIVDGNSYHTIASSPTTLMGLLSAISKGFTEVADIICFTLACGGAFAIIQKAGLIKALIQTVSKKYRNKGVLGLMILFAVFAVLDTCLGTPELCVMYMPIVLPLVISLGFDTLTACSIVVCGSCVGFASGLMNPYTTVISQKLTGLPLFSGMGFRAVMMVVLYVISMLYICIRAKKIQANPEKSPTYELDQEHRANIVEEEDIVLNTRQKIAAVFAIGSFVTMVFGILKFGWDLPQMGGIMILLGIGSAMISGLSVNTACNEFCAGAADVVSAAIMIGIARAIAVVMTEGQILDSIVHGAVQIFGNFPSALLAIGVFLLVTLLNFCIPSGSGKATIIIPILSPVAQIVGINQQTMILAYQFGDGFSNSIFPTAGFYVAAIQMTGVKYTTWLKAQIPLFCIWFCTGCVALFVAQLINYGPF